MLCYLISARCHACKNVFTFDPLFLFEGASAEGPATTSSSSPPNRILLLNLLRSTAVPAKS